MLQISMPLSDNNWTRLDMYFSQLFVWSKAKMLIFIGVLINICFNAYKLRIQLFVVFVKG